MSEDLNSLIRRIEALPRNKYDGKGNDLTAVFDCVKALREVFGHPNMPAVPFFIGYTVRALSEVRDAHDFEQQQKADQMAAGQQAKLL